MSVDLQQFCSDEEPLAGRYSLCEPFVLDGFEYASDARIAVRIPTKLTNTSTRKIPLSIADFFRWPLDIQFQKYAATPTFDGRSCEECHGDGKSRCECCGHIDTCKSCVGTGKERVQIGPLQISTYYDKLIRSLPDSRFAVDAKMNAVCFRSGELQGVVMAMIDDQNE